MTIEHLDEAGETYFQHLAFTLKVSGTLIWCGVLLALHGIAPFILTHAASGKLETLNASLQARKRACEEYRKRKTSP